MCASQYLLLPVCVEDGVLEDATSMVIIVGDGVTGYVNVVTYVTVMVVMCMCVCVCVCAHWFSDCGTMDCNG